MGTSEKSIRVWDLPTRLFHWTTAGLFFFLILTGDQTDWLQWHMQAGYLLSGLILFRILWGLTGSYHSRFRNFVASPLKSIRYLSHLAKGSAEHYQGHNPAGAIMVICLLVALLLQVASGLVTTDDILWEGPLYNSVSEEVAELGASIHHRLGTLLQWFVLLHIIAVLYHRFRLKDPLIGAMVHGRKSAASDEVEYYDGISLPKLVVTLALAGAWVGWLFNQPL